MGHLLRVPDTDEIKQKNKNHVTIPGSFFPEQKTKKQHWDDPLQSMIFLVLGSSSLHIHLDRPLNHLRVFVSSLHIALLHCTLMACHVLLGCLFGTYFVLILGELLVFLQF